MATLIANGSRSWAHNLNDLRERWNIRREKPIRYIVPVKLFVQDIASMSKEELLELRAEMTKLKSDVSSTLATMQSNWNRGLARHTDEEYLDVFHTNKSVGAHIEALNTALSKYKAEYRESLTKHFFDVCKEKLSVDLYSEIMDEANERAKNGKPE